MHVARRFAGPPNMGHGGYVAGMLVDHVGGASGRPIEVTLRRPVALDVDLELVDVGSAAAELRRGEELIAEVKPAEDASVVRALSVPGPPPLDDARAAESGSPSLYDNGRGVHPTCFGCGNCRDDDEGLAVFAGPLVTVDGRSQVAGVWRPGTAERTSDGWILAALDCPGAFAFIAEGTRAGLLGRIVFERLDAAPIDPASEYVVTGWQVGVDGRKMFAGTALFDDGGRLLAAAKATWFGFPAG